VIVLSVLAAPSARAQQESPTVKVFLLAGQSNMEGKAQNRLLDYQAAQPNTAHHYTHLRDGDSWAVRDDVFIKFLDRRGPLTIGYGSPNRTGVELELGWTLGDHFDEPVVLVKAAWGGHALYRKFRPPSSGVPDDSFLQEEFERAQRQTRERNEKQGRNDPLPTMNDILTPYGSSYRNMIAEARHTLDHCADLFPELAGTTPQLAGFVWFQGWNDMYNIGPDEYESNLANLIRDLRRDLNRPNLPVVIAAMGQNGSNPPSDRMQKIQRAQFAVSRMPEFHESVRTIETDGLVDKQAEALFEGWRDHVEEWEKVGSDYPYHYLGSGIWFGRIGRAMGEAMLELLELEGR
jgi:alpha-galactosidase